MMTGLNSRAACSHSTSPPRKSQPPPKSGLEFLAYILDAIEGLAEVQEMLEAMAARRRHGGRGGHAPKSMLRLFCLKFLLNERYNVQLLNRLKTSPGLQSLCELRNGLPSESSCSRYFRRLTEHRHLIESAASSMVECLREELPEVGDVVSIDSTDIEAYVNPNRNPVIDEDASWGVRTPKSRSNASTKSKKTEHFFGYKVHMVADAVHDVPLSYSILPANKNDSPQLPGAVRKVQETYDWLKPKYLVADRGYDSQRNHQYLVGLGIIPIIHIRKPTSGRRLHDSIYTTLGTPTCLGGRAMTYIRTDPDTGKHLYRCPEGGCAKFRTGRNIFIRCDDSHWENPADNLRVISVIPRASKKWERLYRNRQGIERFFGSAKQSRLLDKHQYLSFDKLRTHVALSILTYLATMYGNLMAGNAKRYRHMRIQV